MLYDTDSIVYFPLLISIIILSYLPFLWYFLFSAIACHNWMHIMWQTSKPDTVLLLSYLFACCTTSPKYPPQIRFWNSGEPNNDFGAEDCGEITNNGLWNDQDCYAIRPYLCQRDNGKVSSFKNPSKCSPLRLTLHSVPYAHPAFSY